MSGRTRLTVVIGCLVLVAAAAACGGSIATPTDDSVAPAPTDVGQATTAPPTTEVSATAPPTTDDPTTTAASETTRGSAVFSVPFRFEVPEGSTLRGSGQSEAQALFNQGRNETVLFVTRGFDAWLQRLSDKDVTISEEFPVTLGGIDGRGVDVVSGEFFTLTDSFAAESGDALRVMVVDVEGSAVSVVILTGAENFEAWTTEIEAILETIEWGEAP